MVVVRVACCASCIVRMHRPNASSECIVKIHRSNASSKYIVRMHRPNALFSARTCPFVNTRNTRAFNQTSSAGRQHLLLVLRVTRHFGAYFKFLQQHPPVATNIYPIIHICTNKPSCNGVGDMPLLPFPSPPPSLFPRSRPPPPSPRSPFYTALVNA